MTGKKRKKSVVLVVGPVPPGYTGGIATFIGLQLANPLLADRYRQLTLDTTLGPRWRNTPGTRLAAGFLLLLRLLKHLLRDLPRLVHIHSSAYASFWEKVAMMFLCRLLGRKVIIHVHGGNFDRFFERSRGKAFIRGALGLAHRVVVLSPRWSDFFLSKGIDRVEVVPNCADVDFFGIRGGEAQAGDILFVGSFRKGKGIRELLESLVRLRSRGFMNRLVLAGGTGKDVSSAWVNELIADLGISGVEVLEDLSTPQLAGIMDGADLFVLPSHSEGLPIAMLEAMAAGLPVVATPVGGIPDAIEEGVNGFLVPVGDSVTLADRLERLIRDPELRRRMGAANREKACREYHPEVTARALDRVYRSLID